LLRAPDARDIDRFLENAASPALHAVAKELQARSRAAEVEFDREAGTIALTAPADDVRNFIYGVRRVEHKLPAFTAYDATRTNFRYEAYTFFSDGSRGYDIMGMSQEQIINDVLAKFERYIAQSQSPATSLLTAAPEH
jgi:choline/glycine/proline betaine transport protein